MKKIMTLAVILLSASISSSLFAAVVLSGDQVTRSYSKCLRSKVLSSVNEYIENIQDSQLKCFSSSRPQFSECSLAFNGRALRQDVRFYEIPYSGFLSLNFGILKLENDQRKLRLKYPLPSLLFKERITDDGEEELTVDEIYSSSTSDENYFINKKDNQKVGTSFSNDSMLNCLKTELGL